MRWLRRFVPVAAALLLVVAAVSARHLLTPPPPPTASATSATPTHPPPIATTPTAPAKTVAARATPRPSGTGYDTGVTAAATAPVVARVAAFLRVYLSGATRPHTQWLAALRPLVTDRLYTGFTATDPANLPTGTPGTPVVVVTTVDGGIVRVDVGRTGLTVTVGATPVGTTVVTDVEASR